MTLDQRPSDTVLLEMASRRPGARVNGVELGPESPLLPSKKRAAREAARLAALGDPIDPNGRMNKTERARAVELEGMRRAGVIRSWQFESIALKLGNKTAYHPDFLIVSSAGAIEIEEVKGFWRDDARVKVKVAARLFPFFYFRAIRRRKKKDGGGWHIEAIQP